ncbi:MAG: mechanosensitive ion channel family protein, partial [Verrucomicrobiota bacterium]
MLPHELSTSLSRFVFLSFFGFLLCLSVNSSADELFRIPPSDNSSPRDTVESFLRTSNLAYELLVKDAEVRHETEPSVRALLVGELLRNLDLNEQPEFLRDSLGKEGAACLKEIFDRAELPPLEEIPGVDELEADSESGILERWRLEGTVIEIHRVKEGPRAGDYLFSPESIKNAIHNFEFFKDIPYRKGATPNFYARFLTTPGELLEPIVESLPVKFRTRIIARQALWQWSALAISLVASLLILFFIYRIGRKAALNRRGKNAFGYALTLLFPIVAMVVPWGFLVLVRDEIRLAGAALNFFAFSANLVLLLAALVVIIGLGSRVAAFMISRPDIPTHGIDAQLIRVVARVVSLVLAVIVFLEGGKHLGIPLSTLLASAGVGGLAFALAAQESLKNFFGSIMIFMDKPFRIGDRIVVKHFDGVVEEIGLRSTRIRLLNGHQATLPNEEMARTDIENVGRRPHIRRKCDLRLAVDTPPEKVEEALEIVRKLLKDHEGQDEAFPPRVNFTEILPDSLNLRFLYWYHPPEHWEFVRFSESLNLEIQRKFKAAGIEFAIPLRLQQIGGNAEDTFPTDK